MNKLVLGLVATTAAFNISTAAARDSISIVGSSTVYPFATVVAERFGKSSDFKAPKVESTGSGGGLKLFCNGVGVATPDVANASRRIKSSEFEQCQANGVKDIVEVLIGFDGIVLANAKGSTAYNLTRKDIYLALAKMVPGPDGKLIENPNKTWKDVNSALPASKIEVLGPPPTSGTRDAFAELALEGGARQIADIETLRGLGADQKSEIEALVAKLGIQDAWASTVKKKGAAAKGKDIVKVIGRAVREDGAYIEAGENDNLIVNKLVANPNALGIFGFSFLDQNSDMVQGSVIDGMAPTFDAIAAGDYKVSRPLYFYVKKAHIGTVPGIEEFLNAFISEDAIGEDGYLVDKGLIPLDADKYKEMAVGAKALTNLAL
ncbi:substrate-binding domain-containing protein [Arenicella xantha]|uniref:Phosphate ABC transporter substrate-binding protein (PhoT family) n=1 Tax=Arenicella xantha TaxID=644221 RepID=A0A395JM27_9GAMM|nr:substrate-binding domain-containing protein [Arenicella xantha]RBP50907.1 phosphate ABC transporter substrate-binding protein (PhoT family) [Arenicella xantha]